MKYYLVPIYDTRKSFYNKATVKVVDDKTELYSYETHILTIKGDEIVYMSPTEAHYTSTTNRHINEFLLQNGFLKMTKQSLLKKARALACC